MDIMNDDELRRWCVEKAVEAGAGERTVEVAQEMFEFVRGDKGGVIPIRLEDAQRLTAAQVSVLKAMMQMNKSGEKINGTSIGKHLGVTQSYASALLRKLIDLGYVERDGNKFWVNEERFGE